MYNNLLALFYSMFLITFAEIGDKTQLLVINFASKYRIYKVILGIFLGSLFSNLIAIFIGDIINKFTIIEISIKFIAYIIFIVFGFLNIFDDNDNANTKSQNATLKSAIFTVAISIFIGELGDKTNLSTVALATQFPNSYIYILFGTTLGMVLSNLLSIFIGYTLNKKLNPNIINIISTTLFILFGIIGLTTTIDKYVFSSIIYSIVFCITLTIICTITSTILYKKKGKHIYEQ